MSHRRRRDRSERPAPAPGDAPAGAAFLNAGGKLDRDLMSRAPVMGPSPAGDDGASPVESEDDAPNRVVFSLLKDLDKRLDKYLTDRIPFMSRNQLQRLIDEGGVTVNAKKPKASTVLHKGDVVEVFVPPPPSSEVTPEDIPLTVMYEDEHLIVLNKQPDIIVHPARSHNSGTMINALAYHFRHRSSHGGALSGVGKEFARPGVVHRLDRHTSGLIIFAKDDLAHWKLGRQFELRTVEKRYLALVHGRVAPLVDVIDLPIGPHPSKEKGYREKYVVRHDLLGKPSVTICRVLARFVTTGTDGRTGPEAGKDPGVEAYSLVELELKTGRTHQIRVHLSHLGHPIVADDMYGGRIPALGIDPPPLSRQALHASLLSFRHPVTEAAMTFTAPLPSDIATFASRLREVSTSLELYTPPGAMLADWARDLLGGAPARG